MNKCKRYTLSLTLMIFAFMSLSYAPATAATANSAKAFMTINMAELKDADALYEPILNLVTDALELDEDEASALSMDSFYEVNLGYSPKGYTRQFLGFIHNSDWIELVLIATNKNATDVLLLDRAASSEDGDLFLNTAKLEFSIVKNQIHVWSQVPFRAYQSTVELEWEGDRFNLISHEYDDPTARFYEEKDRLIQAKDIQGLIKLSSTNDPFYPGAYSESYTLATPALKLAYQKALQAQKKDIKTAISYLEFGLNQYAEGFGSWGFEDGTLTKTDIVGEKGSSFQPDRLSLNEYVAILNDYSYFLSLAGRNKEAKPILDNVIKLVPNRTVAYLNIADVEWVLGQKTAAKAHYKQYVKLLGSKASTIAPKRVQERIKAK
ncbi:type IV pilus biogenesis/stability protein PilW [Cohnella sp. WQ 127256]|uniref:tetratricopeptide repeat protein n=1 Tax=Cohnella sp. WQ 127256 TaxID=2938790 RepID=UPI0021174211|nr:hypothetical protein [Cohnella sp. WQ 127256]